MLDRYAQESILNVVGFLSSMALCLFKHLKVGKGSSADIGGAIELYGGLGDLPDTQEVICNY